MELSWRYASETDLSLLADWNHQLIRDEGHRNSMDRTQLQERMRTWLRSEYKAAIFIETTPLAYALFKPTDEGIYLRQFFVHREFRRRGIGKNAFRMLQKETWPQNARLTVDVLCQNLSAIAFWRSVGYRDYCLTMEIPPPPSHG